MILSLFWLLPVICCKFWNVLEWYFTDKSIQCKKLFIHKMHTVSSEPHFLLCKKERSLGSVSPSEKTFFIFFPAVLPSVVIPSTRSRRKLASFSSIPLATQTEETPALMFCSLGAISVELLVAYWCSSALYTNKIQCLVMWMLIRCGGPLLICWDLPQNVHKGCSGSTLKGGFL